VVVAAVAALVGWLLDADDLRRKRRGGDGGCGGGDDERRPGESANVSKV
jgi:hypothetical protein